MKVLHLSTHTTGGAGIACLRLNRALRLINISSEVLVRNHAHNIEVAEIWQELTDLQKVKKLGEQKLFDAKYAKLTKTVRRVDELFTPFTSIWDITKTQSYQNSDVIHLHWVAGFVDIQSFFEKCDKPIVWTLHDYAPFNCGLHYPTEQESEYEHFAIANKRIMDEALTHQPISIVTPSKYLFNQSKKSPQFSKFKHHHIVNPTDETAYFYQDKEESKRNLNIPENKNVLVFVADELSYTRKGYAILVAALEKINQSELHCLVVGDNHGPELINLPSIQYMGHVTDVKKLRQIYCASDVLVMPSLDDNLPNIIVEAHCCGTPVVAFGTGGIPEMITNRVNGMLVSEKTPAELAEEIENAFEFNWDNSKIAETALEIYNPKKIANQYHNIYQNLLP